MPPIIIIGGGIIGCAILHELTKQGYSVTLLEAGLIASGTTGQSGGYVRTFQTDLALTQYSLSYYRNLNTFTETGMDYILPDGSTYHEPGAGRIDTVATCQYWIKGCDYWENTKVLELIHTETTITALRTNRGIMPTSVVILATNHISKQWFQYLSFSGQEKPVIDFKNDYFCFPLSHNTSIAGFLSRDKLKNEIDKTEAEELMDLLKLKTSYRILLASDSFSNTSIKTFDNLVIATGYKAGAIKIAPAIARTLSNRLQTLTVRR